MVKFTLWEGFQRVVLDDEYTRKNDVEFEGERVGSSWEGGDERGAQLEFYRAKDGRIVVHKIRWLKWEGEDKHASVYVFNTLEEASDAFRLELEHAGLIPRRTLSLDEVQ